MLLLSWVRFVLRLLSNLALRQRRLRTLPQGSNRIDDRQSCAARARLGRTSACRRSQPRPRLQTVPITHHRHWSAMDLTVNNSTNPDVRVTLFAELQDGSFKAKVMTETDVPYAPYWEDEVEQLVVYIAPNEEQLDAILAALNERRLPFKRLQDYGSAAGGTSTIPV